MPLRILFIYPTRGRKERFFEGLDSIVNNLADKDNYLIHVTADMDDREMANEEVARRIEAYPNTRILYGTSTSKVAAINRDIKFYEDWDIVCNHADDMRWLVYGFDDIIRAQFADGDLDKLLHIPDSDAKQFLATYYIAGKTYFDRFGYIYHNDFKSLWCDNLVQDIAKSLGKYCYVDYNGLLFHEHPSYGHTHFDQQYTEQQKLWGEDEMTYYRLKNALQLP